jgi:hypothetical protein
LGLSAELAAGGMADVSGPLLVWNHSQNINYALPKPQIVNNVYGAVNNQGNYNLANNGRDPQTRLRAVHHLSIKSLTAFRASFNS